jgi:multimeric flavodoxin WrbA
LAKEEWFMKVLLVNGSPIKDGCCERALEEVVSALKANGIDSEIFWIGNKPIGGCLSCGYCSTHGGCVIEDSVNAFALKAQEADAFVFASPVFYAGMAGNMKAFLDRLFYSHGVALRGKLGAAVVSSRRAGSTSVFDEINKYFTINQMPIVSSRYWNEVHGSTKKDVEKDEEGLYTMRVLGDNMAYLLKCLEAGKKAGIRNLAADEKAARTNFIR